MCFLDKSSRADTTDRGVRLRVSLLDPANSHSYVWLGKDRVALLYGSQLNRLREDLFYIIRQGRKANSAPYIDPEFQRSWSYAAWASFKLEVSVLIFAQFKTIC